MDILELAREHAGVNLDPERMRVIAEKKALITAATASAYEKIKPLSGQQATYAGKRVRLTVSMAPNAVSITMTERPVVPQGTRKYGNGTPIAVEPGEVWYKDSPIVVGAWTVKVDASAYTITRPAGVPESVSVLDDVVKKLAAEIGPMLVEGA